MAETTYYVPDALKVTYQGSLEQFHGREGWLYSHDSDTGRYALYLPGDGLLRNVRPQSFKYA